MEKQKILFVGFKENELYPKDTGIREIFEVILAFTYTDAMSALVSASRTDILITGIVFHFEFIQLEHEEAAEILKKLALMYAKGQKTCFIKVTKDAVPSNENFVVQYGRFDTIKETLTYCLF